MTQSKLNQPGLSSTYDSGASLSGGPWRRRPAAFGLTNLAFAVLRFPYNSAVFGEPTTRWQRNLCRSPWLSCGTNAGFSDLRERYGGHYAPPWTEGPHHRSRNRRSVPG